MALQNNFCIFIDWLIDEMIKKWQHCHQFVMFIDYDTDDCQEEEKKIAKREGLFVWVAFTW